MLQLSLFAADDHAPEPADLEGVLVAHGQSTLVGEVGQVSVVVDSGWRAEALAEVIAGAGLDPVISETGPDGRRTVATARSHALAPVVRRWRRGAVTAVPQGWTPSVGALRAWVLTSGRVTDGAVELGIDAALEQHAPRRIALGEALVRAGIWTTYVGVRGGGPLLRLGTTRARRRLAESIGDRPTGVPPGYWPS